MEAYAQIEKIDADRARELLALNTGNRPLVASRWRILARKMAANEWMFTGQAHVIISSDDVLLNGQHTLTAVVESGAVIETVVVYGVDPAAFSKIDIGWKRTSGNVLSIAGAANANALGAVIRGVCIYDSVRRTERGWAYDGGVDADEILPLYCLDAEAFDAATVAGNATARAAKLTGVPLIQSVVGTFVYLAVRDGHDPDTVAAFCASVSSDAGHTDTDPVLTLRRWTIQRHNAESVTSFDRNLNHLSAWIKTYQACQKGSSFKRLYAWTRDSQDFPRL